MTKKTTIVLVDKTNGTSGYNRHREAWRYFTDMSWKQTKLYCGLSHGRPMHFLLRSHAGAHRKRIRKELYRKHK